MQYTPPINLHTLLWSTSCVFKVLKHCHSRVEVRHRAAVRVLHKLCDHSLMRLMVMGENLAFVRASLKVFCLMLRFT